MKVKHIAALSCAALMASALPLTGCTDASQGGASDFDRGTLELSNYAVEYNSANSLDAVSEAVQLGTQLDAVTTVGGFIVLEKSGKYSVYTGEGEAVKSNLTEVPTTYYDSELSLTLLKTETGGTYDFYMSDGFRLFGDSSVEDIEAAVEQKYIGDDENLSVVWTISESGVADPKTVSYKVTTEDGKNVLTEIDPDDVSGDPPSVSIGGDRYGLSTAVYPFNASYPVEGAAAEYSYTDINSTRVFYKDGKETGRVDMQSTDDDTVCFIGNYMYYTTNVMCASDSGNANTAMVSQYGEIKFQYALNKYDFVNNSHSSYNYNAFIMEMSPLYNKAEKTYDAISISYLPIKNGVVQQSESNVKYAVMDKEFRLVGETMNSLGGTTLYSLDENTFAYNRGSYLYVVDKSLTPIAKVSQYYDDSYYYRSAGLFSFYYNGKVGFTGLDGKVVIEPKYKAPSGNIKFYGNYAYVIDADTDAKLILKNDGSVTELTTAGANESVTCYNGFYAVEKAGTLEIYSFDGTLMKTASGYDDYSVVGNVVKIIDSQGLVDALLIK